jgi:hypothetical protein
MRAISSIAVFCGSNFGISAGALIDTPEVRDVGLGDVNEARLSATIATVAP